MDIGRVSYRFWRKTKTTDSGCVEWCGAIDAEGYGRTSVGRKDFRAHRLAYYLFYGEDPGDLFVLHRCDNPRCVNPRHLFLGDQGDNIQDMVSKGRRADNKFPGELSGRALLTEADVRYIRSSDKSYGKLAKQFGVSRGCVQHAKQGRNWSHVV